MNRTEEVLFNAKARVQKGWVKGTAVDHYGHVCAGQAIVMASDGTSHDAVEPTRLLLLAARHLGQGDYSEVPYWNDQHDRTIEQVIAAFDQAIAWAQEPDTPRPPVEVVYAERELVTV